MDTGITWEISLWIENLWKKLEKNIYNFIIKKFNTNTITCTEVFYKNKKEQWRLKLIKFFIIITIYKLTITIDEYIKIIKIKFYNLCFSIIINIKK